MHVRFFKRVFHKGMYLWAVIYKENLFSRKELLEFMMTLMLDSGVTQSGEIRCLSLFGVKGTDE